MKLDSLALYWNTNDDFGKLPTNEDWVVTALTFLLFFLNKPDTPRWQKLIGVDSRKAERKKKKINVCILKHLIITDYM